MQTGTTHWLFPDITVQFSTGTTSPDPTPERDAVLKAGLAALLRAKRTPQTPLVSALVGHLCLTKHEGQVYDSQGWFTCTTQHKKKYVWTGMTQAQACWCLCLRRPSSHVIFLVLMLASYIVHVSQPQCWDELNCLRFSDFSNVCHFACFCVCLFVCFDYSSETCLY